jgi:hypothetical protein
MDEQLGYYIENVVDAAPRSTGHQLPHGTGKLPQNAACHREFPVTQAKMTCISAPIMV